MARELIVERSTPLPVSAEAAFAWHARPGALERLVPPWLRIDVLRHAELVEGSRAELRIWRGPVGLRWTAVHHGIEPGRGFTDVQLRGPFARWEHRHHFEPSGDAASTLSDRISCVLPKGTAVAAGWVTRDLERLLRYRHAVTPADLAMHARTSDRPLRIAITGSTGFLGRMLIPALTTGGHRVTRLVRGDPGPGEIHWDPVEKGLDPAALSGLDAVIHLAGENIAVRWTNARKRSILESRRHGTQLLAEAIARANPRPRVLLSASAIGYYGVRGEEPLTEKSPAGQGFLPNVAKAWESAALLARKAGVRVVLLRTGLPLSPRGGLLQRMLVPFQLGVGGRLGGGRQWVSWISADDWIGAVHHVLSNETISGPVNLVGPEPVRNDQLTRELASVLHRPGVLPVPAFALRLLFGEDMADQAILSSARVLPEVLQATGYQYRHPTLRAALEHVLGRAA